MAETDRGAAGAEAVTFADVEAAARRIAGHVRQTPTIAPGPLRTPAPAERLTLKLECLQVTGSFKPRGAISKLTRLDDAGRRRGLITASGGNHGLAVAYAARVAGVPATVYLPEGTPTAKAARLRAWGAEVVRAGTVWDESDAAAQDRAAATGATYIHPFADPDVIAGQGTVGLELHAAVPAVDTVVVAVGGGGLISGVATALKARDPAVRVIGVEPTGAPTHFESRRAGRLVTLDRIATAAGTLAPRRSAAINFSIIARLVDDIVLVTDEEMRAAARWLWFELGIAAELSGAAAMAAVLAGHAGEGHNAGRPGSGGHVAVLVCGAGTDGVQ